MTRRSTVLASRGLTLLEVLAATIMLALLAATCSPIIARAMALVRHDDALPSAAPSVTLPDLGEVADAFMADPKWFGVTATALDQIEHLEFACPASLRAEASVSSSLVGRVIGVTRKALAEIHAKHVWLQFECEECRVVRWVPLPDDPASETRMGGSS